MHQFPIDPELRIRANPPVVLRCTTEAVKFIRKMALSNRGRAWHDVLEKFEAAKDEWSAMEAVVQFELLLEKRGLLIEEGAGHASTSEEDESRALRPARRATDPRGAVNRGHVAISRIFIESTIHPDASRSAKSIVLSSTAQNLENAVRR
jgi:hypothetical protein